MYADDIEKKCALCQYGEPVAGTRDVVCEKYGIVAYNHVCKKFKYDIFKKKIRRKKGPEHSYTAQDFSID